MCIRDRFNTEHIVFQTELADCGESMGSGRSALEMHYKVQGGAHLTRERSCRKTAESAKGFEPRRNVGKARSVQRTRAAIVTGVEPVSYTHLDVYKRQIERRGSPNDRERESNGRDANPK